MDDTILYQSPPLVGVDVNTYGKGQWVTVWANVAQGVYPESVYVGEFSAGIQKDAAIARVVALFGDQLAWIDCTHYEG